MEHLWKTDVFFPSVIFEALQFIFPLWGCLESSWHFLIRSAPKWLEAMDQFDDLHIKKRWFSTAMLYKLPDFISTIMGTLPETEPTWPMRFLKMEDAFKTQSEQKDPKGWIIWCTIWGTWDPKVENKLCLGRFCGRSPHLNQTSGMSWWEIHGDAPEKSTEYQCIRIAMEI